MHTDFPQYIQFYPTLKCNFSCSFCFNRGIDPVDYISISDVEALISIVSDIGIREIDILGGEPTLHPKFNQIIDLLSRTKLRTTISSNGSNINLLKNISEKYHRDQVSIGISIYSDSIKRELHEYIVTYKPLLKSIFSKEQAIPEEAKNYIKTLFLEYYLIFMDTLSEGDLRDSLPFYVFFQEVNRLKNLYRHVNGVFCSGFIPDIENYPVLQYVRCPAGTTKLSVMPDGSVYPCYLFFRNEEFRLGNILSDDFYKIWENPVLDFFRIFEKNSCTNTECELFSLCHGGCPAVSFLVFGSLNAPDPRCVYRSSCHSRRSGNPEKNKESWIPHPPIAVEGRQVRNDTEKMEAQWSLPMQKHL